MPDGVQKTSNRPIVVAPESIGIIVDGKRTGNRLEAFGKLFDDWPKLIFVVNRTFALVDIERLSGNIEIGKYNITD